MHFPIIFQQLKIYFRRTYWLANMVKEGKKITGPEQLKDAAFGCARIRGDTLGIVGLGKHFKYFLMRGFIENIAVMNIHLCP